MLVFQINVDLLTRKKAFVARGTMHTAPFE